MRSSLLALAGLSGLSFGLGAGPALAQMRPYAPTVVVPPQGYGVSPAPYGFAPPGSYGLAPPGSYGLAPPGYVGVLPYGEVAPRRLRRGGMAPVHVLVLLRERFGFREIGQPLRDGPVYLVEGIDRRGLAVAVVIDAYDGEMLSREVIGRPVARGSASVTRVPPPGRVSGGPVVVPGIRPEASPKVENKAEAATKTGAKIVSVPPARPAGLAGSSSAPRAATSRQPLPAYPPPVDPILAEKLGAK